MSCLKMNECMYVYIDDSYLIRQNNDLISDNFTRYSNTF